MWNRGLICFALFVFVFLLKSAESQKKPLQNAKSKTWKYNDYVTSQQLGALRTLDPKKEEDKSKDDGALLIQGEEYKVEEERKANQSGSTPYPAENCKWSGEDSKDNIKENANIDTNNPRNKIKDVQSWKSYQKYHAEKINNTQANIISNWPLGIIPYYFDLTSFDDILASRVRDVMDFLEEASCVQFKPLTMKPEDNQNWIHITNPSRQRECVHRGMHLGTGEIRMILGLDCLKRRDVLHTLLHAMGFMDEVSHPYRDQYIRIMWNNIQPKYQNLFSIGAENGLRVEYDPLSIMHFHERAFSKNGHPTVEPLMPGLQIQPSDKLSQLDKMKLRIAFGHECNRRTVNDLLDTCKTVLRGEGTSGKKANAEERLLNDSSDPEADASIELKASEMTTRMSAEAETKKPPEDKLPNEEPAEDIDPTSVPEPAEDPIEKML